jgi:integrase
MIEAPRFWMIVSTKTRYAGIFKTRTGYRVRVRAMDPRTGTLKEANREYEGVDLRQALLSQAQVREEIRSGGMASERLRVGEYAKLWIESKGPTVDEGTAERYADALDDHVLPALGSFYYDQLSSLDVQKWINAARRKGYRAETIKGWFRVLRTMTRDAMVPLDLPRDPTLRITFPEDEERDNNALAPDILGAFLVIMKRLSPQHFALVAVLAFTGLRFCHASALRWEDVDFEKAVVLVVRKNVRGRIGPVSRKKRAPRRYPLSPQLAEILREHRRTLVESQAPGLHDGWVFPSEAGTLRTPGGLWKAWQACLKESKITERFTVHGLRRTFNDLSRRAGVDAVVTKSLTGHVTEKMREHYSTVGLDEKRAAVANVHLLVAKAGTVADSGGSGDAGGDRNGAVDSGSAGR